MIETMKRMPVKMPVRNPVAALLIPGSSTADRPSFLLYYRLELQEVAERCIPWTSPPHGGSREYRV